MKWIVALAPFFTQAAMALECTSFKFGAESNPQEFLQRKKTMYENWCVTKKEPNESFDLIDSVEFECRCPGFEGFPFYKIRAYVTTDFDCKKPIEFKRIAILNIERVTAPNESPYGAPCDFSKNEQLSEKIVAEIKNRSIYYQMPEKQNQPVQENQEDLSLTVGKVFQTKCEPSDLHPEYCWSQLSMKDLQACDLLLGNFTLSAGRSDPKNPSSSMFKIPLKAGVDFNVAYSRNFKSSGNSLQDRVQKGNGPIGTSIVRPIRRSEGIPQELTEKEKKQVQKTLNILGSALVCRGKSVAARDPWANPYPLSFYYSDSQGQWVGGLVKLYCSDQSGWREYSFGPIDYGAYQLSKKISASSMGCKEPPKVEAPVKNNSGTIE